MKTVIIVMLHMLLPAVAAAAAEHDPCRNSYEAGCREVNQPRCREAIESMLNMMKSTPLDKPRDIERNRELIAVVEKMLADNRGRGVDECRSWADFSRILANQ